LKLFSESFDGMSPYSPKTALLTAFPRMKELSKQVDDVMEGAEETLSEREFAGCDTSWARAHLFEAEWRIGCTSDYTAASDAVERLKKALVCVDPPDGLTQDRGGSFAPGTKVFFLKLDRSTDQLLAGNGRGACSRLFSIASMTRGAWLPICRICAGRM
jgi:hypothetical protein